MASHCRLNGTAGPGSERYLPEGLPLPLSTRQERQAAVHELTVQLDHLEKQLQESSKVRPRCCPRLVGRPWCWSSWPWMSGCFQT